LRLYSTSACGSAAVEPVVREKQYKQPIIMCSAYIS
jgi:hypothetical protein